MADNPRQQDTNDQASDMGQIGEDQQSGHKGGQAQSDMSQEDSGMEDTGDTSSLSDEDL